MSTQLERIEGALERVEGKVDKLTQWKYAVEARDTALSLVAERTKSTRRWMIGTMISLATVLAATISVVYSNWATLHPGN